MGTEEYKKFEEEIEHEKISEIIEEESFNDTYTRWSERVIEIASRNQKKKKIKRDGRINKKLLNAKKKILRALRRDKMRQEEREELKRRRDMISEYIEEEEKTKKFARVNKIVAKIKEEGGLNSSTTFGEFQRRLRGKKMGTGHAVEDENGVKQENPEKIKGTYVKYFKQLLTTMEARDEQEKEIEEIMEMTIRGMKNALREIHY